MVQWFQPSVALLRLVFLMLFINACVSNAVQRTPREAASRRPNVLMIIADDFKPIASSFGSPLLPKVGTKNIDRLVNSGISFMNAHAQMAICGPSRASFLTSLRPDALKIYGIGSANELHRKTSFTRSTKEALTLPKLFKLAGYETYGIGKIFHENENILMERPDTWTVPVFTWLNNRARPPSFTRPYKGSWIYGPDVNDDFFADGQAARLAASLITDYLAPNATARDAPWFLAVGFWKPHLPWAAPAKYFNMSGPSTDFHGPFAMGIPKNLNGANFYLAKGKGCGETREYKGPYFLNAGQASLSTFQQANRAYHATSLYMDAQVGRVLDALEASSSSDNTIIVFLGDHGFHLGDKGLYCKHTNYEQAVRVPLVFVPPRRDQANYGIGRKSFAPVELLDLVPTLRELAGLNVDTSNYRTWQGVSLFSILKDPQQASVKQAAVSQYFRGRGSRRVWGYTVRTTRYRYTNWGKFEELYDLLNDEWETVSLHTNATLKQSLLTNAYYGGTRFDLGVGKQPFDFGDSARMANKPSPRFA